MNERLLCKNCQGIFVAVETGTAPVNVSFPYCHAHTCPVLSADWVRYVTTSTACNLINSVTWCHCGQGYQYTSSVSFQWSSRSGTSAVIVGSNRHFSATAGPLYQGSGKLYRGKQPNKSSLIKMAPPPEDVNRSLGANMLSRPREEKKGCCGS